jgi:hypothetical protein
MALRGNKVPEIEGDILVGIVQLFARPLDVQADAG